ncbi:MAG: sugar ABC transporter permease, partial [Mesorhizobium sp. 61-13]
MTMASAPARPQSRSALKRAFERYPFLPALIILVVLMLLNGWFQPRSLSLAGVTGLIKTYLALMFLAVAQTYVIYAGDIDLSAGAIVSLVNVVIVAVMTAMGGDGLSVMAALVIGIATGLACGLINGLVVAALRLQAIVATFATSIFFTGLALYIQPVAGTPAPAAFWRTYGGRILEIPFVFYAVVAFAILLVVLVRTRLSLRLLAVGDGQQEAYQSGLPVTAIRMG